ncbi:hypothetical protein [Trichloromonas sp.]|jgi:hypothetical protein|uniref:hypothetical protein n=1 Tax=Trichloromonas sp. TaxID=3069249 RepID=UPI002A3BEF25|nr:hypothetical protein [Trichloromonas sp.]
MAVIEFPTMNVQYIAINDVYLVANDDSVNQFCTENGWTMDSYESEEQRFSNDGSLYYQYWDGSQWVLESGYRKIVTKLVYTE